MAKPSVWEEIVIPKPDYQMVDLGLSVKWADRNVGAASPEAYGDYFAWGETAPRGDGWEESAPYDWAHAPFNGGIEDWDEEYFSTVSATVCSGGVLASEYDAAHVIMGGSWRMATSAEIQELLNETTQSVEELNGIPGMRFTAPNGNSIFMPFCGRRIDSYVNYVGDRGYAWSSSLYANFASESHDLYFHGTGSANISSLYSYNGFVVRGVC